MASLSWSELGTAQPQLVWTFSTFYDFFLGGFPYPHITRDLKHRVKTRLISIESQPKKIVVVVVVVIGVVVVVVHVVVVVIPVVDPRNLPLKFG